MNLAELIWELQIFRADNPESASLEAKTEGCDGCWGDIASISFQMEYNHVTRKRDIPVVLLGRTEE